MRRILLSNFAALFVFAAPPAKAGETTAKKQAKVVVAIIDTGLDPSLMNRPWICKHGNKDFTGTGLEDNVGHGTHISGIIEQYAKNVILDDGGTTSKLDHTQADFCEIIIKFFDPHMSGLENLGNTVKAFRWAIQQHVDVINYSAGGDEPSKYEKAAVEQALNLGIKVVVAAGNEHNDLAEHPYYPALYDSREFVVGNLVKADSKDIAPTSNYGKAVNTWERGTDVTSRLPQDQFIVFGRDTRGPGIIMVSHKENFGRMTGTSQATAVKSGKLVREMLLSK